MAIFRQLRLGSLSSVQWRDLLRRKLYRVVPPAQISSVKPNNTVTRRIDGGVHSYFSQSGASWSRCFSTAHQAMPAHNRSEPIIATNRADVTFVKPIIYWTPSHERASLTNSPVRSWVSSSRCNDDVTSNAGRFRTADHDRESLSRNQTELYTSL